MQADLHNKKGEKKGKINLPESVFGVKVNTDIVYQVMRVQMFLRRRNIAHTKDRSEVRGGGRKPWRQKGTGRARHGSSRSPIWKGGGVTFGPRNERNFKKKVNKKVKRKATAMVLSSKLKNDAIYFVSDLNIKSPKTKEVREFLEKTPFSGKKTLIVLPEMDRNIILASRNLEKVKTIQAREVNVLDLLSCKYLIVLEDSVKVIEENLGALKEEKVNA